MQFLLALLLFISFSVAHPGDSVLIQNLKQTITSGLPMDWFNHTNNANSTYYYCNYTGVTCFTDNKKVQHLVGISLANYSLKGQLPLTGWAGAKYLSILNFSHNHLSGPFPTELFGLWQGELLLNHNNFNNLLPSVNFSGQITLRILNLSTNRFSGCIPSNWKTMTSLDCTPGMKCTSMDLDHNYFNCSDYYCMTNLPTGVPSFCPPRSFLCHPGKFCWHIPQTIVAMVACVGGGFVVGNLLMFFATKYLDLGLFDSLDEPDDKQALRGTK